MNNFIRSVMVAGATIIGCQAAFATYVPTNLYLGFQNSGGSATADYIINLGAASSIIGGSSVVNLTSKVPGFPAALLGNNAGATIQGGVIGGDQYTPDIYYTQTRSSLGTPSVPGSSTQDPLDNIEAAISQVNQGNLNAPGTNIVDTAKSWRTYVDGLQNSFGSNARYPDSTLNVGGVVYEDLYYQNQDSTTPVYQGYFTLDLTAGTSSPVVTFTPKNASAPAPQPGIQSVSKTGSTVTVISTNAAATHMYQLQYTATLNPTSWNNVGSAVTASATMVTNTDTTATDSKRFYRVQAQ